MLFRSSHIHSLSYVPCSQSKKPRTNTFGFQICLGYRITILFKPFSDDLPPHNLNSKLLELSLRNSSNTFDLQSHERGSGGRASVWVCADCGPEEQQRPGVLSSHDRKSTGSTKEVHRKSTDELRRLIYPNKPSQQRFAALQVPW